jgi:hypothetical protein
MLAIKEESTTLAIKEEPTTKSPPYKKFEGSITDPLQFLQEVVEGLKACGPVGWFYNIAELPGFENIFGTGQFSKLEAHRYIWYEVVPAFPELFLTATQEDFTPEFPKRIRRSLALRISHIPPCTEEKIWHLTESSFFGPQCLT